MNFTPMTLELDDYAAKVGEYFEKKSGKVARKNTDKWQSILKSPSTLLPEDVKEIVRAEVPQGKNLVMYGHGSYHHFTYGLCAEIADKQSKEYAYVHIDNHHDTYHEHEGMFNCGSFVRRLLTETNVKSVRYIGSAPPVDFVDFSIDGTLLKPGAIKSVSTGKVTESVKSLEALLEGTPDDVYLTIDLDVMPQRYVTTSAGKAWGVGMMDPKTLMKTVDFIKEKKNIIGADILGYTGGSNGTGLGVYSKLAGRLVGEEIRLTC
ncbi:MAG: arginase family protein [Candidatus Aenigmarchaeota archaeon]|nr:arginase family protein [Candidatus Aenigmarchaeota archaeon]